MDLNFAAFHFLRPWWLLALLPAAIILMLLIKRKRGHGSWTEVCDAELLPFLLVDKPIVQRRGSSMAVALAAMLAILSLAGPTWQRLPTPAFRNDSALVIALDLSASMDAADIKPSRIAKARYKIADLLKSRKDGQTALLVYGGDTFIVTPLTGDTATIASQLEALSTDIMPSPGTNTGSAIRKAVELLQQAGVAQGHVLLVADGVDADSAALADHWLDGYRLSVLGVGTGDGAPIPQAGGGFAKDAKGGIIVARLDENALAALAQKGKGLFQPATAGDDDVETLGKLFNSVADGGKNQEANLLLQQWDEKGPWLMLLILPWAAMRFRKGLILWAGLCLLPLPRDSYAFDWQNLWQTPDQQASQAFQQQQYQQAAEQFQNPDWRAAAQYKAGQYQQAAETLKDAQTAEGQYNRGNALAQAGQLQEALQAYQQALKLNPQHQDAQYNKGIVEKKLQEQQKQQNKDQQQDKQDKQDKQNDQQQSGQQKPQDQQGDGKKDQQDAQQQNQDKQQDRQEQKSAQDKQQDAENGRQDQPKEQSGKEDAQKAQPKTAQSAEQDETQRANEQLLKRIPDEPTGLLKRKFKYQYSQRGKTAQPAAKW